jgi:uncharacterized protein YndB with AHSA1/START domain
MTSFPETGSASIDIAAPPEVVWGLVADITRMGEWSPECWNAHWEDGSDAPAVGACFHGYNRAGTFEWDVPAAVTECEQGKVFAFEVPRGGEIVSRWRFDFASNGTGTTLTESFDVPMINVAGAPSNFEGRYEMLVNGIETTIANIKAAAESLG